ncbi:MAG TPA: recombinase family protein [Planctomycetaceae bacterium]|nr:recombinase family protein [Planctomycetaceae bacterium]HQZ63883.1 recombinase family protein [Planctomycetaceae bacterium]HRA90323.1 recombinase family protein [Planctomycetaceae bacterium]
MNAEQGKFLGQLPFGYDLGDDGETLVKNAAELKAVFLIRSLKTAGFSLRAIARRLEAANVPTKSGLQAWSHTAVQSILRRAM